MKTLAFICFAVLLPLNLMAQDATALRKERDKLVKGALWKEALDLYRDKLMPVSDPESGKDLDHAIRSLRELGEWKEFDPLVEQAVAMHPEKPGLLRQAALAYQQG